MSLPLSDRLGWRVPKGSDDTNAPTSALSARMRLGIRRVTTLSGRSTSALEWMAPSGSFALRYVGFGMDRPQGDVDFRCRNHANRGGLAVTQALEGAGRQSCKTGNSAVSSLAEKPSSSLRVARWRSFRVRLTTGPASRHRVLADPLLSCRIKVPRSKPHNQRRLSIHVDAGRPKARFRAPSGGR